MSTATRDKVLKTAAQQAEAIGVSVWEIKAMRKAALGQADTPFCGKSSTYTDLMKWRRRHPEFVPSQVYPKRLQAPQAQQRPAQDPAPASAGKSRAPSPMRGPRSASPVAPALPRERAA